MARSSGVLRAQRRADDRGGAHDRHQRTIRRSCPPCPRRCVSFDSDSGLRPIRSQSARRYEDGHPSPTLVDRHLRLRTVSSVLELDVTNATERMRPWRANASSGDRRVERLSNKIRFRHRYRRCYELSSRCSISPMPVRPTGRRRDGDETLAPDIGDEPREDRLDKSDRPKRAQAPPPAAGTSQIRGLHQAACAAAMHPSGRHSSRRYQSRHESYGRRCAAARV